MKRRKFLGMVAGAVALGMSPAFLNATALRVDGTKRTTYRWGLGNPQTLYKETILTNREGKIVSRCVLDEPIAVTSDDVLEITYEYRLADGGEDMIAWAWNEDATIVQIGSGTGPPAQ